MPVWSNGKTKDCKSLDNGSIPFSGFHAQVVKWQTRMVKVHVPSGVEVRILSWVLTLRPDEAIGSLRRLKIFVLRVRIPLWVFLSRGEATGSLFSLRMKMLRVRIPLSVFSRGIKNIY